MDEEEVKKQTTIEYLVSVVKKIPIPYQIAGLATIVVILGFFLTLAQQITTPQKTTITPTKAPNFTEIINKWKIYKDPYNAFTFKYPLDMTLQSASDGALLSVLDGSGRNIRLRMTVEVKPNPLDVDPATWAEQTKPDPDERTNYTYEEQKINGTDAVIVRATYQCLGICDTVRESRDYDVIVKGKGYVIVFSGEKLTIAGTSPEDEKLVKDIVKTVEIRGSRIFNQ